MIIVCRCEYREFCFRGQVEFAIFLWIRYETVCLTIYTSFYSNRFSVSHFPAWKSWHTYYVFLCLFIVSLTSKLFVLISFSTVKFLIFIDCCLIKMLRFDILYFICFVVKDKKIRCKKYIKCITRFFYESYMNTYLSEDFYHFLTLLKALKFSMKVFNEFWKALWTYLTICWNVREIKITDYTPDSVI